MPSFPSLAVIATDLSSSEIGGGIHNSPTYALVYTTTHYTTAYYTTTYYGISYYGTSLDKAGFN